MKHKGIKAELAGDSGQVRAIFSVFNVEDHDGDVTIPGAFEDGAKVRISAYNHASWGTALPVGIGTIHQDDEKAWMDGQFFMDTTHGADTFRTVKQLDDLGEWSYGYDVLEGGPGQWDGKDVNFLRKLKTHEVSPVLLGAGIGTRTVAAKSLSDMDDDEVRERASEACKALLKRGITLPQELVEAVRTEDTREADIKRRHGSMLAIAARHGIDIGGGR